MVGLVLKGKSVWCWSQAHRPVLHCATKARSFDQQSCARSTRQELIGVKVWNTAPLQKYTHTHTQRHTHRTHTCTHTHTHGKHAHTRGVHTHRAHTHTHTHTHSRLWEHLFDANVTTSSREEIAERAPGGRRGIEGLWQGCLHSKDTKSEGQTQLKRSAGNCGVRVAPLRLWELLVVVHPSLQFQEKHRGGVTSTQQLPKPWQGGWVPLVWASGAKPHPLAAEHAEHPPPRPWQASQCPRSVYTKVSS